MAHGIQTLTNSGFIQLDENYARMQILAMGHTTSALFFTEQASPCLVMVRPAYGVYVNRVLAYTAAGYIQDRGAHVECDYCLLTSSGNAPVPTSGYGLCVMDAESKLAFSSMKLCFNIDTVIKISAVYGTDYDFDLPVPLFGRRFFCLIGSLLMNIEGLLGTAWDYWLSFALTSETHISARTRIKTLYYDPSYYVGGNPWYFSWRQPLPQDIILISGYTI